MLDFIVMQMNRVNREKGYFMRCHGKLIAAQAPPYAKSTEKATKTLVLEEFQKAENVL